MQSFGLTKMSICTFVETAKGFNGISSKFVYGNVTCTLYCSLNALFTRGLFFVVIITTFRLVPIDPGNLQ